MRLGFFCLAPVLASLFAASMGCGDSVEKTRVRADGGAGGAAEGGAAGAPSTDSLSGAGGGSATEGGAGGAAGSTQVIDGCEAPTGEGTDVASAITADETWDAAGSPYRVSGSVYLTATLTLEPCTVVELDAGSNIFVGNDPEPGAIVAHGTAEPSAEGIVEQRIRFQRLAAGSAWSSLLVDTTGLLDFEYVTIEGGGSAGSGKGAIAAYGADAFGEATVNLRLLQTRVVGSETYGINLLARAAFSSDSSDVSVVDSGSADVPFPIYVEAGAAFSLPAGLLLSGNTIDEVVIHPFAPVFEDTFPARGVTLRLDTALYLQGDVGQASVATLTIQPGVDLRLDQGAGSGIYVGADTERTGRIVAEGTEAEPIVLRSAQEAPAGGDWMGLYYRYPAPTGNVLSYVTIRHAGGPSGAQGFGCGPAENNASVLVLTDGPLAPFMDHCSIEDAGGDTQLLLGWNEEPDPAGAAQAFLGTNTLADSPACGVSLPRGEGNACPGNADPDCL